MLYRSSLGLLSFGLDATLTPYVFHSTLAWYYMRLGNKATTAEDAQAAYSQSAEYYIGAAKSYPLDEEQTLIYYKVALEAYWFSPEGKTLEDMLPLFFFIHKQLPHVVRIWEHSALANSRDAQVVQALDFATRCQDALESGKITPKTFVRPKELVSAYSFFIATAIFTFDPLSTFSRRASLNGKQRNMFTYDDETYRGTIF